MHQIVDSKLPGGEMKEDHFSTQVLALALVMPWMTGQAADMDFRA